jgi:hypothetical protein
VEQLDAYLDTLFAAAPTGQWIEVRRRLPDGRMAPEFFSINARDAAATAIRRYGVAADVYVGCAPRARRSGRKDAIGAVWALWVDCDSEEATDRAGRWHPAPTMIVRSGSDGAAHVYWRLEVPLPPIQAELANLRLARSVGADDRCHDAGRILRPPTTLNHKHKPPAEVGLDHFDEGRVVRLTELLDRAKTIDSAVVESRWERRSARDARNDPLLQIPPREYVTVLLGAAPGRNGKVACPFHRDARPSLHVYGAAERGWCCFSCGRAGSIYDMAAALWGLETRGRDFVRIRQRLLATFAREQGRSL